VTGQHAQTQDLGRVIGAAHLILWGDGKYPICVIALSLCLTAVVVSFVLRGWGWGGDHAAYSSGSYMTQQQEFIRPIYCILLIEELVNVYFGYRYAKTNGMQQVFASTQNPKLHSKWLKWLHLALYGAMVCAFLNFGRQLLTPTVYLVEDVNDDNFGTKNRVLYTFMNLAQYTYFVMNYYLAFIWVWIVHCHCDQFRQEILPLFTEQGVESGTLKTTFFNFVARIDYHRRFWTTNHVVRSLTGVLIVMGKSSGC